MAGTGADQTFKDAPPGQIVEPCPLLAKKPIHWISIELVDDFGKAVANEPFEIVFPDGTKQKGALDDAGKARFDVIVGGDCKVTFPERDPLWWTPGQKPEPPKLEFEQGAPLALAAAQLSWIELQLNDDAGNPVPNEPYILEIPDGKKIPGELDESGYAWIEGLKPGTCKVTFPQREATWFDPPADVRAPDMAKDDSVEAQLDGAPMNADGDEEEEEE